MGNPFFSIITVCFNAGQGLLKTVESVINQTYTNFELIIKDGGSIDGSFEKVPTDIRIIKLKSIDSGIYDAMNQALKLAKGDYILFLNADDYFFNDNILQLFYNSINKYSYPHLVYCDYMTTRMSHYVKAPSRITPLFLFRNMLCHQVCMLRKDSLLELKGFDINFRILADWDFLLRLFKQNKIKYNHLKVLGVVYTSGGYSEQNSHIAKRELIILRKKHYSITYYLYYLFFLLSFPNARKKIISQNGFAARLYQKAVNKINSIQ
jgi:glycosyltransferase involved in cell wall biosynthesis